MRFRFSCTPLAGACALSLSFIPTSAAWSAGTTPKTPAKLSATKSASKAPASKPSVSAPSPSEKRGERITERLLGGQLMRLTDDDDIPPPITNFKRPILSKAEENEPESPESRLGNTLGGSNSQSSSEKPFVPMAPAGSGGNTSPQAAAVLGPAPYDLGRVKRIRVATRDIGTPPMRVGNMDILSPMVDELSLVGATVTKADSSVIPDIPGAISQNQFFQVNRPGASPVVLQIGKASAWIDKSEQPLRAAPLAIGNEIYLPVFSIAPLIGSAARLDPQGTLVLTPTVQSAELFVVNGTIAATIKSSLPLAEGAYKIVTVKGNKPKIYIDFTGYSMGFDAGNTTVERLVANGVGQVKGIRAGQPNPPSNVTRVVLDLNKPMYATLQRLPDPRLVALVLSDTPQVPEVASAPIPDNSSNPGPGIILIPDEGTSTSLPAPMRGSLKGWKIVVDAGHGAHDVGARGRSSLEKNHNLDIARRLATQLRARGATVLMTRDSDVFIPLSGRSDFANTRSADLFISVHINSSVNKGAQGTETFFYTGQSRTLASQIHREFAKATGRPNRGVAQARFWVIRKTWMPSVLLECAFISNAQEEKLLMSPAWREKVAQGIARGVINYSNVAPPTGARG